MRRAFDVATSRGASLLRLGLAREPAPRVGGGAPPDHSLTLYEYEASPWCRLVREHMTHLGLSVLVKPVPRETLLAEGAFSAASRYRGEAMGIARRGLLNNGSSKEHDGKTFRLQFPMLVDASARFNGSPVVLTESKAIIAHLWKHYGQGVVRPAVDAVLSGNRLPFIVRFASLAGPSALRPLPSCGLLRTPSAFNEKLLPLELYQAEHCSESRLVREKLSTLEIACLYHNGNSSHKNATPVLIDPNVSLNKSGLEAGEKATRGVFHGIAAALSHLDDTYSLGQPAASLHSPVPDPNLGSAGSFFAGARNAMASGGRDGFLPRDL